jgi:hypothetical protein
MYHDRLTRASITLFNFPISYFPGEFPLALTAPLLLPILLRLSGLPLARREEKKCEGGRRRGRDRRGQRESFSKDERLMLRALYILTRFSYRPFGSLPYTPPPQPLAQPRHTQPFYSERTEASID